MRKKPKNIYKIKRKWIQLDKDDPSTYPKKNGRYRVVLKGLTGKWYKAFDQRNEEIKTRFLRDVEKWCEVS